MTGICKSFAGVRVLHDVSLTLYGGEVHCLVGENGAGKSTLIKIISGAYFPDQGTINYLGQDRRQITLHWARENGINTIYQEIDLVPHLTAIENILLGAEPLSTLGNVNMKAAAARAMKLFERLGIIIPLNVPLGRLRLAQQQMVAIAKALHLNSRIIIFDEPTSVFTNKETEILFRIINELKAAGLAVLYISHHMEEIFKLGDRITVLRDGELIQSRPIGEFNKTTLIQAMIGRDIEFNREEMRYRTNVELLSVKNLSAGKIVNNVSFSLYQGELLGFGGLVGAGRTELMRLIAGVDRANSGKIFMHDRLVHIKSPRQSLRQGIGMLPENRAEEGIVAERPVKDNLSYSLIEKISRLGLVKWKTIFRKSMDVIREMTVQPRDPQRLIKYLSGGNQQKVVLGKLLAADCDIVILDEPTRGVDVGARAEIYGIIRNMLKQGKAVIMVSSDMTELLSQSDRILVMCQGSIVAEIDGKDATEEKVLTCALGSRQGGEA
ncbi:MAG: sugar ABC transporter ATP-binding protein [Treponema sp.]|nr:sugar ABC transporter ATP-binding protein [Treponema sp.]